MIKINKENFSQEIENYKGLCVIDLYAEWCGPCKMLSPILAELEAEYSEVKFCKINVDEEPELAAVFRVQNLPTVAFVKDDTYLDMSVGYVKKEHLSEMINEYTDKD